MAERVNEIYSLLVPLTEARLIIPRACVAEVIGFQTPSEMTGAPPWYIGTVPWNGKAVPLVSFEGACGQMIPPASGRTRIVVLHALGTRVEGGHFALVSQGFPQLVRVSSDVVRPDNSRVFPERMPVICQIRMVNETPLVPDLERLEEMIADETSIGAPASARRRRWRGSPPARVAGGLKLLLRAGMAGARDRHNKEFNEPDSPQAIPCVARPARRRRGRGCASPHYARGRCP